MSIKKLENVTSYDLLKTAAFLLMLIDHIGVYFYPDELWLRLIGRLCVPIWCFLIGYAVTRKIGIDLWAGVIALTATNIITGGDVFPVTILLTFIVIRTVLDKIISLSFTSKERSIILICLLFIALFPTMALVEYGTAALALALSGYAVRHGGHYAMPLFITGFVIFLFSQIVTFNFGLTQSLILTMALAGIAFGMWRFKPLEFPNFTHKSIIIPLKFIGRHTLFLYVFHLILFKLISASFGLTNYSWFKIFLTS